MAALVCIRREQQPVTPWQNGGGSTRQIAIDPPHGSPSTGFRWRISQAQVASDGPFSHLPGVDRSLWLANGRGMRLTIDNEVVVLDRPWQRVDFAGETPVSAQLLDGPCEDLNVMTARHAVVAAVQLEPVSPLVPHRLRHGTEFVLVLEGEVAVRGASLTLAAGDALRLPADGDVELEALVRPGLLLVAAFVPRA